MKKINRQLAAIKHSNRPGFMMHIVAGYPDMGSSERIAAQIFESGADFLEIQIPFSDPVADGPVIASANEISLKNGTTVQSSLDMIQRICDSTQKPVLIMTYFNIVHHYGVERFCEKVRTIGVQGLIVPDYPFDEDADNGLIERCRRNNLALIQVIASTTRPHRLDEIVSQSSGFVYCVARTGITGRKTSIDNQTIKHLQSVRAKCDLPISVGFGLSEKSQIQALEPYADIMIVGSALIREYADKSLDEGLKSVDGFIQKLITS